MSNFLKNFLQPVSGVTFGKSPSGTIFAERERERERERETYRRIFTRARSLANIFQSYYTAVISYHTI
jgi:hypothetical protein